MRRALAAAMVVSLAAAPAIAAPNAQLVASVQQRLNKMGFSAVDAGLLSTRQIAALHMQLQGGAPSFGPEWVTTRQKVTVILGWDTPAT